MSSAVSSLTSSGNSATLLAGLEKSLLVRRVLRIPAGILEHAPLDDRRCDRVVIPWPMNEWKTLFSDEIFLFQ